MTSKTLLTALCLVTAFATASLGAEIKFDQGLLTGSSLTYNSTTGVLQGRNIAFDNIIGVDTLFNDGDTPKLVCDMCALNFDISLLPDDGSHFLPVNPAGTNTFALTGTILSNPLGSPVFDGDTGTVGDQDFTGTILSGTFSNPGPGDGASLLALGGGSWRVSFTAGGTDTKADPLVQYFFGTTGITFDFFNTDFKLSGASATLSSGKITSFSGTNLSNADLNNTPTQVPEPSVTLLALMGLAGLVLRRKRA